MVGITIKNAASITANRFLLKIYKGSSGVAAGEAHVVGSTFPSIHINIVLALSAADVLTGMLFQDSGGDISLVGAAGESFFYGFKLIE